MIEEIKKDAQTRMQKSIDVLLTEYKSLRSGKANPSMLDKVVIEAYGQHLTMQEVATVHVPQARLITIEPWDKSIIGAIEKAIQKAELGINPMNDGKVIKLAIPSLTEEVRKNLVKIVKSKAEDTRVSIRNIRREANDDFKSMEKESTISKDDNKRAQDEIQKITDKKISELNKIVETKEKDIMTVQ